MAQNFTSNSYNSENILIGNQIKLFLPSCFRIIPRMNLNIHLNNANSFQTKICYLINDSFRHKILVKKNL